jgi:hypothetical protein
MRPDEDTITFDWYLVKETDKARCFSNEPDGSDSFWVPRSLTSEFVKYPAPSAYQLPKCTGEVPLWFAVKEGIE